MSRDGIVEIFKPVGANSYTFDADNTVTNVSLDAPASANTFIETEDGKSVFPLREGLILDSVYLRIPYCFPLALNDAEFRLSWVDTANTFAIPFSILSLNGGSFIPAADTWIPFDVYEPFPEDGDFPGAPVPCRIRAQYSCTISQINAPDSLNGETLPVQLFVKVLHTNPLTT